MYVTLLCIHRPKVAIFIRFYSGESAAEDFFMSLSPIGYEY